MQESIDYARKWYVMAAIGMGVFLSTIDGSIVNVALPTLVRELGTDFATVQWVVLAYLLVITTLMLSVGRLADMKGKKPLYTAGFIIFTAGSALCGLAPAVSWLIAFRMLQAVGATMVVALGSAIVTEAFPPAERGRALGIIGSLVSVGIVLGPTLGGLIIGVLSWRWIFIVNLPVGIVGTLMVVRFVPATRPPGGQRFDYGGALTLFVSLTSLLLGLTLGQPLGFGDWRVLLLFAVWVFFLLAFIVIEVRVAQPMIDLELFKSRLLSINLITGFLIFICLAGTTILMPFYLENALGYSTRQVGLLMAVVPVMMGSIAPISGALSDRFGTRPITVLGLVILLVGFYAVSTLELGTSAWGYILRFLPVGVGLGVFQSPNNSAVMGSAPRQRLGIVSGMLALTRTLGQTVGIAILGAVWAGRVFYHAGGVVTGGATAAAVTVQVAALRDTCVGLIVVISVALGLGVWGLVQEWQGKRVGALEAGPS
jgi:EmrB/QacA subfamily drug resistance transporter